jgi:hypothetical protein
MEEAEVEPALGLGGVVLRYKTASGLLTALPNVVGHINLLANYADALLKQLDTCSSNAASLREFGMPRLPGWIVRTLSVVSVREDLK